MAYTFVQFLDHMRQAREDALGFVEAKGGFQSDREREAYGAGYQAGSADAHSMLKLHAGVNLSIKPRREQQTALDL